MKEREFQAWIIDVARLHGWSVWHVPTPMRPIGGNRFVPDPRGRGLCDLLLMRADPPQVIFAEVKNENGTVDAAQREFLNMARAVADEAKLTPSGIEGEPPFARPLVQTYLWRPAHRDLIEAVLSAK